MFHTRPRLQSTFSPHFPIICSSGQTPEEDHNYKAFLSQILERLSRDNPLSNSSVLKKVAGVPAGVLALREVWVLGAWPGLRSAWVFNLLTVSDHPETVLGLSSLCMFTVWGMTPQLMVLNIICALNIPKSTFPLRLLHISRNTDRTSLSHLRCSMPWT